MTLACVYYDAKLLKNWQWGWEGAEIDVTDKRYFLERLNFAVYPRRDQGGKALRGKKGKGRRPEEERLRGEGKRGGREGIVGGWGQKGTERDYGGEGKRAEGGNGGGWVRIDFEREKKDEGMEDKGERRGGRGVMMIKMSQTEWG